MLIGEVLLYPLGPVLEYKLINVASAFTEILTPSVKLWTFQSSTKMSLFLCVSVAPFRLATWKHPAASAPYLLRAGTLSSFVLGRSPQRLAAAHCVFSTTSSILKQDAAMQLLHPLR